YNRSGCISSHATGVEASVALSYTFVVLCIMNDFSRLAVGNSKYRGFIPLHKLFDNKSLSSIAKAAALLQLFKTLFHFVLSFTNKNALAPRQSVGFKHYGIISSFLND